MRHSVTLVLVTTLIAVSVGVAHAQTGQVEHSRLPTWRAPAPEITVAVLDAPSGTRATLDTLKGRAIVLDFWATWCSGCIVLIPHLNELTTQFRDKPVQFISVTDEEDEHVVRAFLKRRPITGWVALDNRGETFKRYGITGRPYAALIDAHGVLRGVIPSAQVDRDTVQALIDGTLALTPSLGAETPTIGTESHSPLPLLRALVRPAMPADEVGVAPGFTRLAGNRWETWGVDLRRLLSTAYDVAESRVALPENASASRYDVSILLPDDREEGRMAVLRQLVQATFGMTVRRETRDVPVTVLGVAAGGPHFAPLANGKSLRRVVGFAEMTLRGIVVDETGLTGTYDFVLAFPSGEAELRDAVAALGLTLTPARRPVELLVAEPLARQ